MTAAARRAFRSVVQFLSMDGWVGRTDTGKDDGKPQEETHRVGEFCADYSPPTEEQLRAPQPEVDELFKNSKPVSR